MSTYKITDTARTVAYIVADSMSQALADASAAVYGLVGTPKTWAVVDMGR